MAVIECLPSLPLIGPFLAAPVPVTAVDAAQLSQVPVSLEQHLVLPKAAADEFSGTGFGMACSYPVVIADMIGCFHCTPGPSQMSHCIFVCNNMQ